MEFNDGSQYRIVTDPARHMREREMYEFRACSAKDGKHKYVDTAFTHHRNTLGSMRDLLIYQFPYQNAGTPESQAHFFIHTLGGSLRPNETVMLDTEGGSGLHDPADFMHRWCAVVEPTLQTLAAIYVPSVLANALNRSVTGPRLVKAPRYSGHAGRGSPPWWPYDIWQYTDKGYFPGCQLSGDVNFTNMTVDQLLERCNRRLRAPVATTRRRQYAE